MPVEPWKRLVLPLSFGPKPQIIFDFLLRWRELFCLSHPRGKWIRSQIQMSGLTPNLEYKQVCDV